MDTGSDIGRRARQIRKAKGKSLAVIAGRAGISVGHLSNLEAGRRSAERRSLLEAWAAALEVAPSDLLADPFPKVDPIELEARAGIDAISMVLAHNRLGHPYQERTRPWPQVQAGLRRFLNELVPQCDYLAQAGLLPELLEDLYATHATDPAHRQDALVGLMYCLQHGAALLKNLGAHGMPHMAAMHMRYVADELDDPAWIGAAEWRVAQSSAGDRARMLTVSTRAIEQLEGHSDARALQASGMNHLNAALACAALERSDDALAHLSEARDLVSATETVRDDFVDMHFNVTNWGVWRVAIGVELGEGPRVAEHAADVDISTLAAAERQGMFYADLARGLAQDRTKRDRAVAALRSAEKIAPQRVRTNPYVRDTLLSLIYQAKQDAVGRELRGMAYRAGLPV